MAIFTDENREFQTYIDSVDSIIADVSGYAKDEDIRGLYITL